MEEKKLKVCKKHGLTEYVYIKSASKYKCRKCLTEAVNNRRRKAKEELVKYKGGKCEICGYNKCIDSLEFHHINPEEKEFGLSNGNCKSIDKLKKEADKCILVCSNCHHEIHYKIKMEKINCEIIEQEKNKNEYEINCEKNNQTPVNNLKKQFDIENIKLLLKSKSQKEIAKICNCSLATLKRFLKDNGLTNDKEKHKMKYMTIDRFILIFKKNNYMKTLVAKELGVKTLALNEFCYRNNIPWHKEKMIEYMENYHK